MSRTYIDRYFRELENLRRAGATGEGPISQAFGALLKEWGASKNLVFLQQQPVMGTRGREVRPDGVLRYSIRVEFGLWEAKRSGTDIDAEIAAKKRAGYPLRNIVFENAATAVLYQNGEEARRAAMDDADALEGLVAQFFAWERPEVRNFIRAVQAFQHDLPAVLGELRNRIDAAYAEKPVYRAEADRFLDHARGTINPNVTPDDVREMLIQHILTEDIFATVFREQQFHRENNVAKELYELEEQLLDRADKHALMKALDPYYGAIRAAAAAIENHGEKQTFLKVIYESFYRVYDPKKADRLGVIYTPNEIVRFMVEGADWLCREHFGKGLADEGVEILDPAAGTGTFVVELLNFMSGRPDRLHRKYKEELHANEVAILPYYVANLNIEATYANLTGQFGEFENLCFVDTLDNVAGLRGSRRGFQADLLGAFADENAARIRRQNARRISVVIGNPPYNANQQNENDNNKNRQYPHIDRLIRDSYVAKSTAQKTKVYDMYARFFRWATDRLGDEGIIAFVSNSSFVETGTFDGFRACAEQDFSEIWIVDLKGNARTSGERRKREAGNVFEDAIRVGVAISFFVRNPKRRGCTIRYQRVADYMRGDDKRAWLAATPLWDRRFERVEPDRDHNWINLSENDWNNLLPICEKGTKQARYPQNERAIFRLYSLGISTNRDEWAYGWNEDEVGAKVRFFLEQLRGGDPEAPIKWSRNLKRRLEKGAREEFIRSRIGCASYRPFTRLQLYKSPLLIDEAGAVDKMFPPARENRAICFNHVGARVHHCLLAADGPADLHFGAAADAYQQVARYRYTSKGERVDNITDWALRQFQEYYGKNAGVTKDAIFAYVYAALHDPVWRETYVINLKREFPRIQLHRDFRKWVDWGERLLALHIGYETVEPWPVKRRDTPDLRAREAGLPPKPILKSDRAARRVILDSETILDDFPDAAWEYRLGNRCGIDWVLDQHKEKTPRDPTIRERFDTYRFADHKEKVADLIVRVARVSAETMEIVAAMRTELVGIGSTSAQEFAE